VVAAALSTIRVSGEAGKQAIPAVIDVLNDPSRYTQRPSSSRASIEQQAWYTLADVAGAGAPEVTRLLLRRIDERPMSLWQAWSSGTTGLCLILASIAPLEALRLCRHRVDSAGKNLTDREDFYGAIRVAKAIGVDALPMLRRHVGLFSGERGKVCEAAIRAIIEHGAHPVNWKAEVAKYSN
jgi:hypothetical protein